MLNFADYGLHRTDQTLMRTVVEIIGRFDSLSNGSKSFEKAIDIKRKKKSFHVQRAFLYIHLQRLYEATTTEIFIMRRFNMWDDIKQNIIFLSLSKLGCGPKNSSTGKFTHL